MGWPQDRVPGLIAEAPNGLIKNANIDDTCNVQSGERKLSGRRGEARGRARARERERENARAGR